LQALHRQYWLEPQESQHSHRALQSSCMSQGSSQDSLQECRQTVATN
jgi:hypothetical protein